MLKIEVREFGAPEALVPVEAEPLEAEDGRVVIRAEAIGVNFADVWVRLGAGGDAPITPGIEVAGTVKARARMPSRRVTASSGRRSTRAARTRRRSAPRRSSCFGCPTTSTPSWPPRCR